MARKKAAAARLDSCGRKLNKGESQRADGRYVYQWTDAEKKRRSFYADTLQDLREQEKQLEADLHDGIRSERPNVNAKEQELTKVNASVISLSKGLEDTKSELTKVSSALKEKEQAGRCLHRILNSGLMKKCLNRLRFWMMETRQTR